MMGAMAMRLAPLIDYSLWGSDWGEYYGLTQGLVASGQHVEENLGWGRAYVDFPGLFDLAGGFSQVSGLSVASSISLFVPCVTAASCLLVACIVFRLVGNAWAALVSAIFLAVAFPEVYQDSHPVPGAIGSTLFLAVMLVFIIGDTWRRERGPDARRPLALHLLFFFLVAALTVTHHLSLFFAVLALAVVYLLRSVMVLGTETARSRWAVVTLVGSLAAATIYWLALAPTFREEVMVDLLGIPAPVVVGVAWLGVLVLLALGPVLGSRRDSLPRLMFWGPSELTAAFLAFIIAGSAIVTIAVLVGFPGTDIELVDRTVIYILPLVLGFALGVGSTDVALRRHGGLVPVGGVIGLTASFLFATAIGSQVLVPYRHLPYIAEIVSVLIGIGVVHLRRMTIPEGVRWSRATGTLFAVFVVALVLTAYPPKDVMGGFQEGTDQGEVDACLWLRGGLPVPGARVEDMSSGVVATDHRLSSMAFGIGDTMATWDTAGPVLYGGRDKATLEALGDMDTPHGDRPVGAVLLSRDFRTGAALSQFETSGPVVGEAWDKFFQQPFVRLYDGGDVWVLGVPQPLEGWMD